MSGAQPERLFETLTSAALALALVTLVAGNALAQDAPALPETYWLAGMSVGIPSADGQTEPELATIGAHWTKVRPGRLGPDISIGTMPRVVAAGLMVVGVRAGVALPLTLAPGLVMLPSGGISLIGVASTGGAGGVAGFNAGAAAVLYGSRLGVRTGLTWHRFQGSASGVWLMEIGVVGMPKRSG